MSTYIVQKTGEWSLKHQSLSLPDSALCLHTSPQEEGVLSETPKPIIARWCTMCTYIVHKTMYVDKVHYRARLGFGVSETYSLVLWTLYVDVAHYRATIGFGVQRPLPCLVNYVCRHSTLLGNDRLWCSVTTPRLWTMYVHIVHHRAMIGFGVSESTPSSCGLCM